MPKYVTTFIDWRSTLVSMQQALASSNLSTVQSGYGYGLLQDLLVSGAFYDTNGDDSPDNVGTFSVNTCQPYMDAATPLYLEQDRICRYIYAQYASTVTLPEAQAYGLYLGLTTLPPGITQPTPLTFVWALATFAWDVLGNRTLSAEGIALQNSPGSDLILLELYAAIAASSPYFVAPINSNPASEALSVTATNNINVVVAACQTWLNNLSFQ